MLFIMSLLRLVISYINIDDCFIFFFFSSRRRHTRLTCDWSSDVVLFRSLEAAQLRGQVGARREDHDRQVGAPPPELREHGERSEERRVGKECRSRWSPYH